ncbi:quinone oxidoreductase [Sphingomonas changbaiensis NBRC 104936]|uniref:Quinone oxidoreductase n=1 Tax=Sphingomonas changbaiensis NBRC 104936 TaxID=1219043 RepID=A0A0E9MN75_9SPHN|nr:quinone oxidoreductase [Sphingomonas changbaiensis]GAO39242.1 quinone oxidoreductase [Sphingomonas changbaiensis NBRC 104936]
MARVARIERTGGPEVIEWADVDLPPPRPGEVRMRNTAVGLNYIDTYHRGGVYPVEMPAALGLEAAGVVEAVGEGVTEWKPGDRVGTYGPQRGAYATERNLPASSLLPIPDDISDEVAAASLLKGCTAEFLVERCARVEAGWPVLVHAAAGGVGSILVQWLKAVGARVIGTVSTDEKAAMAREAGADEIILYTREDTASRVRELTGGAGVRVTFDGVGMATWDASLGSTARRGLLVSYGNAGGPVSGVNLGVLAQKGSLFVTRPTLFDYYVGAEERRAGVARLWDMIRSGKVAITIGQRYPLEQAAQAHRDLEARKTSGSTILTP